VKGQSTPALYRTRITHLRRAPVHHYFEHTGYSWYVDVDRLPNLPWWLRPFARFDPGDHFWMREAGGAEDSLRHRIDSFLAERGVDLRGGRITALMQARVLGYAFNPLTLYWCHDADGVLRHVIAEVHTAGGRRHAYLMPSSDDGPATVRKRFYTSPFNPVDGYYLVHAPRPDAGLDIRISLHRENQPAFVATLRSGRRRQGIFALLGLQLVAPLAPLMGALGFRLQTITLRLRGVPVMSAGDDDRVNSSRTAEFVSSTARSRLP
jgi:DUF1365 family protein